MWNTRLSSLVVVVVVVFERRNERLMVLQPIQLDYNNKIT